MLPQLSFLNRGRNPQDEERPEGITNSEQCYKITHKVSIYNTDNLLVISNF